MTQKAPERIWAEFGYDMRRGAFWDEPSDQSIEYLHIDHALALVVAAYEDAGDAAADVYDRRDLPTGADLAGYIRTIACDDAQAALERVKREARNEALREAAEAKLAKIISLADGMADAIEDQIDIYDASMDEQIAVKNYRAALRDTGKEGE